LPFDLELDLDKDRDRDLDKERPRRPTLLAAPFLFANEEQMLRNMKNIYQSVKVRASMVEDNSEDART